MRVNQGQASANSTEGRQCRINLVKLCVGARSVLDLESWQAEKFIGAQPFHITRMHPKRENEILNGGSLYWVIDGCIQARQRIADLDSRICDDGVRRCAIVFDRDIIRTVRRPRRPFQGWRYLEPKDSPPDLPNARGCDGSLPAWLEEKLDLIGVVPASLAPVPGNSDFALNK